MRNVFVIFKKELTEILRNRRALITMILLPILVIPLMVIGFSKLMFTQINKMKDDTFVVAVEGDSPAIRAFLNKDPQFVVIDKIESSDSSLKANDIQAIMIIPSDFEDKVSKGGTAEILLKHDSSYDEAEIAIAKLQRIIRMVSDSIVTERFAALGISEEILHPILTSNENLASPEKMGGSFMGRHFGGVLAFIIIMMILTGAYNGAVDLFAGERERGTLETLLVSPAGRLEIAFGKFFTVVFIAIVVAMLNLVSLSISFQYMMPSMGNMGQIEQSADIGNLALSITPTMVLAVLSTILPLACLFSAVFLLVSAFAQSYKEAQSYLSPIMLLCQLPLMATMLPGINISTKIAFIPLINVSLLFKKILSGEIPVTEYIIVLSTTILYALIAVLATAKLLTREEVLFSEEKMNIFSYLFKKKSVEKIKAS